MNITRRYLPLLFAAAIITLTIPLSQPSSTKTAKAAPRINPQTKRVGTTLKAKAEAPVTDLVIDAMEVTQAVQDLNNSVPLVMGKRTFVRVFAHSTDGTYPTTASLKVQAGSMSIILLPIAPGGPFINVKPSYLRLISSHAFLFELPIYISYFSPLTLTAVINPELFWHPHSPEEFSYSNNSISKIFTFNEIPPLSLVIATQPYTFNGNTFSPTVFDTFNMADWIKRAYPVNQLKIYFRTLPVLAASRKLNKYNNWDLVLPNCYYLNSYLAYSRASIFGNPFYPNDLALYAMASDTVGFMRGCAPIGGYYLGMNSKVRVASGPSGNSDFGWDHDGTYADWYGGHEMGHALSQSHVKGGPGYVEDGCGGEAGSYTQWANGRISPTMNYFDAKAVFGFDYRQLYTNKQPVLGPNWHDMMTYCDYQWISSLSYLFIQVALKSNQSLDQLSPPRQPELQDVLAIFGAIDLKTNQVTLQPTSILYSVPDVIPPAPGNYAVVLHDADGSELERYSFSPHGADGGQAMDPSSENQYAYISELVPYVPSTANIQLEGPGGRVLAQVNAGLSAPVIEVTAPIRGSVEDGDTVRVAWNASDPDGDPLTFNIEYSFDNGSSWEPAGLFYTDTETLVDITNLPASNLALVRVSASDGINTTRATSDPFIIPNHIPTGEIIRPATDITVAVSQTVTFEAQVYDIDLGSLDGTEIQWSSSMDGFLGPGSIFNTENLSVGNHTITMTADDGQGGVITDQVGVIVVPTPNDLPPQPDALQVEPEPVFLEPAGGIPTASVYVDNLNLGNAITWNASPDQPWLVLSEASGTTPQEISVSSALPSSARGIYHAAITFTSPQAPDTHVTIHVVVTIPSYKQLLPLTKR